MKDYAEKRLIILFATARLVRPDTSAAEEFFDTRLMARIKEKRERILSLISWAWRLIPAFMMVILMIGVFGMFIDESQSPDIFTVLGNDHVEYELTSYLGGE